MTNSFQIPVEILIKIFSLLPIKSKSNCAQVSQQWHHILYSNPLLWPKLDHSNRFTLGGDKVSKDLTTQLSLSLNSKSVTNFHSTIFRFSKVTHLDLSCTSVNLAIFKELDVGYLVANSVTNLCLSGCTSVTANSISHVSFFKSLVSLDISHCDDMDDVGLHILAHSAPWIRELNLSYLFKITDNGIKKLFKMPLTKLNLMGCCRIKSYPWAIREAVPDNILPLKSLSIGEDSRIQTRGFWLLWCTWQQWDFSKIVEKVPFLECLRLNMVLYDLPAQGMEILLRGCRSLSTLALVVDRNIVETLCNVTEYLQKLESLEITFHIGVTAQNVSNLLHHNCFKRLKSLKFHSRHSNIFNDELLKRLITQSQEIEYFEMNGEDVIKDTFVKLSEWNKTIQSIILHHSTLSNSALKQISKCKKVKEITATEVVFEKTSRLRNLVRELDFCLNLRKIEINSKGFTDNDLASIPNSCPNLQWIDFQFPFTFPKTMTAIARKCANLLFLRLHRVKLEETGISESNDSLTQGSSSKESLYRKKGKFLNSLYGSISNLDSNTRSKQSKREAKRQLQKVQGIPKNGQFSKHSEECKALERLSSLMNLRVLDLSGNQGLNDLILQNCFAREKVNIHTLFLDGADISAAGLRNYCEKQWKKLKRVHIRNCSSLIVDVCLENFLKALEINFVADGRIL